VPTPTKSTVNKRSFILISRINGPNLNESASFSGLLSGGFVTPKLASILKRELLIKHHPEAAPATDLHPALHCI
jgi:hypothetical protein